MVRVYHVDRLGDQLIEGQIIHLLHTNDLQTNPDVRARYIIDHWPEGLSKFGVQYLGQTYPHIQNQSQSGKFNQNSVIEIVAEQIRISRFLQHPSRFQSFFAFRSIADARKFADTYPVNPGQGIGHKYTVWEVEANAVDFQGDMNWLNVGQSWLDLLVNLDSYWSGKSTHAPVWELLLRPPITVVQRITT